MLWEHEPIGECFICLPDRANEASTNNRMEGQNWPEKPVVFWGLDPIMLPIVKLIL